MARAHAWQGTEGLRGRVARASQQTVRDVVRTFSGLCECAHCTVLYTPDTSHAQRSSVTGTDTALAVCALEVTG